MIYGSLFSGCGGLDAGLHAAGLRCAWSVESDPQRRQVLAERFPEVPQHEEVRDVGSANLAPVDLIVGGFPCQDLSVAGRRGGLAGERSGLFFEFARCVEELRPRWLLVENVPGLLSSNDGRDMGALLWKLAELGYWWAYRVLDSQFFGVAQRRRRVYIVGRARDGAARLPGAVLFDAESLSRHPPTSGEAWADAPAGTLGSSTEGGVGVGALVIQDASPGNQEGLGVKRTQTAYTLHRRSRARGEAGRRR